MLHNILDEVISNKASDLHLVTNYSPTIRINGALLSLPNHGVLTGQKIDELVNELMDDEIKKRFEDNKVVDFSYTYKNKVRFRVNVYLEQGNKTVALRLVPTEIKTLEDLNLPDTLFNLTQYLQGLVLVVGPTGHGKSTTLASLLEVINSSRAAHILTIEDPIEYIFKPDKSIITQREVINDTKNFYTALTYALRQDPDVIMVGEMRDRDTIATAMTAAETGHLVFATMHTNSAAQTIDRIINSFPSHQQDQARMQLASILLGVVSQRLVPKIDHGLVPAVEVMITDNAIKTLIRDNKTYQINTTIATNFDKGMLTLNRSLSNLVKKGEISLEIAQRYSLEKDSLKMMI